MKELVLFNKAAKIIFAGLSTFGNFGTLAFGFFTTLIVLPALVYCVKKCLQSHHKLSLSLSN